MSGRLRAALLLGCAILAYLHAPQALAVLSEGLEGPYPPGVRSADRSVQARTVSTRASEVLAAVAPEAHRTSLAQAESPAREREVARLFAVQLDDARPGM